MKPFTDSYRTLLQTPGADSARVHDELQNITSKICFYEYKQVHAVGLTENHASISQVIVQKRCSYGTVINQATPCCLPFSYHSFQLGPVLVDSYCLCLANGNTMCLFRGSLSKRRSRLTKNHFRLRFGILGEPEYSRVAFRTTLKPIGSCTNNIL